MNELAEHLIIKGKNTFACLYVCLHSKICKNTLYYMRFFEILHKELNTQKCMNLFPMWSFCNSSRCALTISHKDRNMHKHTHAQTHTYKCTLTYTCKRCGPRTHPSENSRAGDGWILLSKPTSENISSVPIRTSEIRQPFWLMTSQVKTITNVTRVLGRTR